jgi:hypothetical protein
VYLCCQVEVSDHSSRGVWAVACHCVWSWKPHGRGGHSPRWAAESEKKNSCVTTISLSSDTARVLENSSFLHISGVPMGVGGDSNPLPRNSEVLTKISQILSSLEKYIHNNLK